MKPRALDLFCCAGGAGMGLHRAGFDVVGVDIEPRLITRSRSSRRTPLTHPLMALTSSGLRRRAKPIRSPTHPRQRASRPHQPIRPRLKAAGVPWCIENVVGAPLG